MTTGKLFQITCTILLLITIFIQSCKKDAGIANTPGSDTVQTVRNTAPVVNAGADKEVFLPADSSLLTGSAYDNENNIANYSWKKLTGPAGGSIDNPDSLTTKVRGLKAGDYSFELTVTDLLGLQGRDTVNVYVIGENELIFRDRVWIFPWFAELELEDIYNYIPVSKPIKVFIKRDNSSEWQEATPISNNGSSNVYEYFIETRPDGAGIYNYGSLYITYYGSDTNDTPDVKIQF
jgi:hypothetical protein